MLALKTKGTSTRPPKSEQLRIVAAEAATIRELLIRGEISSEEATRRLTALRRKFAGFWDKVLAE